MIKEFEINDILNAVNDISKKETKIGNKKKSDNKNNDLTLNNPVKSDKSEILVLDQMIE